MTGEPRLRTAMFLRSFLIQATWNFERLQNLGFAFLSYPSLVRRYGPGSEELARSYRRNLESFNTHPYFSGLVGGAIAHEEGGEYDEGPFLSDLKLSLMSSLGSIGDAFFWATLRPLAILAGLVAALFGMLWAPLLLLLLFNVPHITLRWWGVSQGMRRGCQVVRSIQELALPRLMPSLGWVLAALTGLAAGVASIHPDWSPLPAGSVPSLAAGPVLFVATVVLAVRGISPRAMVAGLAGLVILVELARRMTGL